MEKNRVSKNNNLKLLITFYTVLLLIVIIIACYFAYSRRKEEILSQMDRVLESMAEEYQETIDNFWKVYMPAFESQGTIHPVLPEYFTSDLDWEQSPLKKQELSRIMEQMLRSDNHIQWLVFYSGDREKNYIYFRVNNNLQVLPDDSPYLEKIKNQKDRMEIWGMHNLDLYNLSVNAFSISGGIPFYMGDGQIVAGYDISPFEQICQKMPEKIKSLEYTLVCREEVLYSSKGDYDQEIFQQQKEATDGLITDYRGSRQYVKTMVSGTNESVLYYCASWWELFRYMHSDTLLISMIGIIFSVSSVFLYLTTMKLISKEIGIIRKGLVQIGENHLDYRIPNDFRQSGLPEIADAINQMTVRLNENINRAYYYELKQKDAELSELQAKFNPHFLYNSLEMLRSRCLKSGDDDTANLITQLAAIFRGFIGKTTFIPLTEELAFSNRYLALFGARYDDQVEVLFDVDSDILEYGIIRNLLQPLIENYFVHGYDISAEDNYFLVGGHALDEKKMLLFVEDNGCGMTEEQICQLNATLQEPIRTDKESYGLKNLHQRIRLFYGEGCGLSVSKNGKRGIRMEMTVLKMTCEEYEKAKTKS